ncbi:hypothetical protein [Rosenbergiella australiborealis]|uniref:hypothetical protein n=1 Tax=Rosenbergiella australiborealis TaxID=1544696 RepID=UPI001F4E1900|nr:hypothetical protein [Rosenbergiella australiborealis]
MGKVTYVVEYEDGKEPPVYSDMEVAGGRLTSVMWSNYRDGHLLPEELDIIDEALTEIAYDIVDAKAHGEIMNKLRLMTQ